MSDVIPISSTTENRRVLTFFERIREGCGRLNAAYEVGWSPKDLRDREKDQSFVEMYSVAVERRLESIEETTFKMAEKGNITAIQMVLYSFGSDRGWRPPQQRVQVEQTTKHQIEVVANARELVLQMARGGAGALQESFRPAIETSSS